MIAPFDASNLSPSGRPLVVEYVQDTWPPPIFWGTMSTICPTSTVYDTSANEMTGRRALGDIDGLLLGRTVGLADGAVEGCIVGLAVGFVLGVGVGGIDGLSVGSSVGLKVGLDVGAVLTAKYNAASSFFDPFSLCTVTTTPMGCAEVGTP